MFKLLQKESKVELQRFKYKTEKMVSFHYEYQWSTQNEGLDTTWILMDERFWRLRKRPSYFRDSTKVIAIPYFVQAFIASPTWFQRFHKDSRELNFVLRSNQSSIFLDTKFLPPQSILHATHYWTLPVLCCQTKLS